MVFERGILDANVRWLVSGVGSWWVESDRCRGNGIWRGNNLGFGSRDVAGRRFGLKLSSTDFEGTEEPENHHGSNDKRHDCVPGKDKEKEKQFADEKQNRHGHFLSLPFGLDQNNRKENKGDENTLRHDKNEVAND